MNRVYARTAVSQLYVGQNQSWTSSSHCCQGLRMGAGDFGDAMTERLDERLDIHSDYGLVFHNQDVSSDLVRNLDGGPVEEILRVFRVTAERQSDLLGAEPFDGAEDECDPRARRQRLQSFHAPLQAGASRICRLKLGLPATTVFRAERHRTPYAKKHLVERDSGL